MGASSRISESLSAALSEAYLELELPDDKLKVQDHKKPLVDLEAYRHLLAYQFEIIGHQETFLKAKNDKIKELEDQVMKLKRRVRNLENVQSRNTRRNPINLPKGIPRLVREKGILRRRGRARTKPVTYDFDEPPRLSPVYDSTPPRRATRTSSAGTDNSRWSSPPNSVSDLSECFSSRSSPRKPTENERKSPARIRNLPPAEITLTRLRNPSNTSKPVGQSHNNTSLPVTTIVSPQKKIQSDNSTPCTSNRTLSANIKDSLSGLPKSRMVQKTNKIPERQVRSLEASSSATEFLTHRRKLFARKKRMRKIWPLLGPAERRNLRNRSTSSATEPIKIERSSVLVNEDQGASKIIPKSIEPSTSREEFRPNKIHTKKEDTSVKQTRIWESPLILNENENCLTTKIHYYTTDRKDESVDSKYKSLQLSTSGVESFIVEVPSWREKVISKSSYASGIEDLDDSVFLKRHEKLERDERRRKRWDAQRLREEQYLAKLKSRSDRRYPNKDSKRRTDSWSCTENEEDEEFCTEFETFQPKLEDATCIRVEDDLPISAFGFPLPIVEQAPFELPWEVKARRPKRSRNEVYYNSSLGGQQQQSISQVQNSK